MSSISTSGGGGGGGGGGGDDSGNRGGGDGGGGGDRGRGGGGGASLRRDPAQGTTSDALGSGGVGRGVGGGGGGGGGDDPARHPHQAANTETVFPIEKRIEAYDGENEELDNLEADMEIQDGAVPVGPFGERQGNQVRCLVCHDFKKKKFSEKKLYYHQLCDPEGRQALCLASTEYIRKKIRDSLAKKEAAHPPPLQDGAPGP